MHLLAGLFSRVGDPARRSVRLTAGLGCAAAMAISARADAQSQGPVRLDLPAQTLSAALDQLGRQAGAQILYPYQRAAMRHSKPLRGRMTIRTALEKLLRGSGLEIATIADRLVTLHAAATTPTIGVARRARRSGPVPAAPAPSPPPATDAAPLPDILVTGRAATSPMPPTELSYAVSRIDAAALARRGPLSTADLFKLVPGFWVEATGGEASNNVRSRGIPTDGYSSVSLLEDGLPIQYDGGLGYLNTDQIYRIDATVERAEAVRGGPSAIFEPNAPGGSMNFVTRTALHGPGMTLSVTGGNFGYRRVEGFAGVRIAPDLGMSVGGFYRADDGLRDPGYPADRGGQVRVGVDYDDGRTRLSVNVRRLDDRVILYLPVPLRFDATGKVRAIPGFDPLTDTLAGPDEVHVPFRTAAGPQDFDLSQGTRSRITFVSASGHLSIGDDSALEVRARLRSGTTLRNGLFPIGRPMTASGYLDTVRAQLAAAFPGTVATAIRYADDGSPFPANANGNGLVIAANLLSVWMPMTEWIGDARLTRALDWLGHHDVAIGATYDDTSLDFDRTMGSILLDVRGQARRLDIVALDRDGGVVGALTDNGFIRYGSLFDRVRLKPSNLAIYWADEWKFAPRWRVDLGARWERTRISGRVAGAAPRDLGDPTTLADDTVLTANGTTTPIHRRFSGFNATIGINFRPATDTGLFVRLTRIARLPSASDFISTPDRSDEAIVPITMAEAGMVLQQPRWTLSAVAFRSRFARLPFTDYRFDTVSYSYAERTSIADTTTIGLELAAHADLWGPLKLDLQATLQDPRYRNFRYTEIVSGQPVTRDFTGNQLIRVPRLSLRVTPSLVLFDGKLRIDTEFVQYSARFADIANSQRLPPYSLVNIDADARVTDRLTIGLHITNLTNALGLTEGNPRGGSFDAGGMTPSYFLARPEFSRTVRTTLRLRY